MDLTYTGQQAIHVVGAGTFEPDETRTVHDEALAESLLARPDFTKKRARTPRTRTKTAKAPAKAKTT